MATDTDLVTESGKRVPQLTPTPSMVVDKNTVLYGPTKTGKTVLVKYMMNMVREHIDQVLVIAPTEPTNGSYAGIVRKPLIHYKLWLPDPKNPRKDDGPKGAVRFLEAVLQRQAIMASIYARANDLKTLAALYARLPTDARREGHRAVAAIDAKRAAVVKALEARMAGAKGALAEKKKEINDKFKLMLALVYKRFIAPHHTKLLAIKNLPDSERWALTYLTFNPRILLVFDDCAAELKPLFKKGVFRQIFYQGRHSYISSIICVQDDTDLDANLRKNALMSIFTTKVVAAANFERKSNNFTKEDKIFVSDASPEVFVGNRKLVYIREDPALKKFYHLEVAIPPPFEFGSKAVNELCDAVSSRGVTMDESNPYYSEFKI